MTKTSILLISIAAMTFAAAATADAKIVMSKVKRLDRGSTVMLNPQPLPPASKVALNPQPLPPRR
jgi:hypothetical protein